MECTLNFQQLPDSLTININGGSVYGGFLIGCGVVALGALVVGGVMQPEAVGTRAYWIGVGGSLTLIGYGVHEW